ncbi:MAG: DNA polymerase III subunit delta [Actinobacteria bacterium]|nr:MAG: DNA polymerase III subunit delta [Actinomycetota bacterium]
MAAAGQGILADYVADPAPFTTLVLSAAKPDKRTRLYKVCESAGYVSEFKAPKRAAFGKAGEYGGKVVEMFSARGKRIGKQAAEQLVEAVGEDLRRLSIEVGKACAYVGDADTVTGADIDAVLSLAAPTSVWDFIDAFGERDTREALKLLAGLISEGETPIGLWGLTLMHLRRLLAARAMLDRGERTPAIMRELGLKSDWHCRKIEGQAKRYTAAELECALREAAATEQTMKTSRDDRLALERWIARVCGGCAA